MDLPSFDALFQQRFKLSRELGRGAMGLVVAGERRSDGLPVAIKILDPTAKALSEPCAHALGLAAATRLNDDAPDEETHARRIHDTWVALKAFAGPQLLPLIAPLDPLGGK